MDSFLQAKTDTLKRIDKSSKGSWDKHILKLCNKINSLENYYTTSSCSGRVVVMVEQKQKGRDLFLFVSHEKISSGELKRELEKIITLNYSRPPSQRENRINETASRINLDVEREDNYKNNSAKVNERAKLSKSSLIKFKFDPCIIHVVCKDLKFADELLRKAQLVGWKKSGLLNFGKKIILELNSTEKLEFPTIKNGKILVNDNFLKLVTEESNKKLSLGWLKIQKLKKTV